MCFGDGGSLVNYVNQTFLQQENEAIIMKLLLEREDGERRKSLSPS
jgi:hypothetical protein